MASKRSPAKPCRCPACRDSPLARARGRVSKAFERISSARTPAETRAALAGLEALGHSSDWRVMAALLERQLAGGRRA